MSSSQLLQQCPACLVRLTRRVFVMGGRWPYSWYFVECCRQDLFKIARNILVSPCCNPATMSKYSVSPSSERTFTLVFL